MKTRKNKSDRRGFESLEDRRLMTVNILLTKVGIVKLTGNSDNDTVVVSVDKHGTTSTSDDRLVVNVNSSNAGGSTSASKSYKLSSVKSLEFHGNAGNDTFKNLTNIASLAYGGSGKDILIGGTAADKIYGGDNDDYVDGRLGNDKLYGDAGNDILAGDKGNDLIHGGLGNDYLYGGDGVDSLDGQSGNDWLDGGAGTEKKMIGGTGTDFFHDGTLSFPGGDFKARASEGDQGFKGHPNLGAIDMNFADDNVRWQKRFDTMLTTTFPVIPTFVPTPDQIPTPTVDFNAKALAFAQSKIGQIVGGGGCTDLVVGGLAAAGAKPGSNFEVKGHAVWGQAVTLAEAKPGDAIQFFPGTSFLTIVPGGSFTTNMDPVLGHAAVIESVNGTVLTLLEQNAPAGSAVHRSTLDLSKIQPGGGFQIYQPIAP
jgi:hypothetical protein